MIRGSPFIRGSTVKKVNQRRCRTGLLLLHWVVQFPCAAQIVEDERSIRPCLPGCETSKVTVTMTTKHKMNIQLPNPSLHFVPHMRARLGRGGILSPLKAPHQHLFEQPVCYYAY